MEQARDKMKKPIVIYYSNNGSNRYVALKVANDLGCPIEEIRPRINVHLLLLLGLGPGNKKLRSDLDAYDRVILCGPIWMGKFISPLKRFVSKYKKNIKDLIFVTCCGSSYAVKDDRFGHGHVFKEVEAMLNGKCTLCVAFPVTLVLPEDMKEDPDAVMKARLSDENFKGEIKFRYDAFIKRLSNRTGM